jgi:hypothetical protein
MPVLQRSEPVSWNQHDGSLHLPALRGKLSKCRPGLTMLDDLIVASDDGPSFLRRNGAVHSVPGVRLPPLLVG